MVGWVPLLVHQKLELAQLALQQKPDPLQQQPQVELELPQVELQQVEGLVWPLLGWASLLDELFYFCWWHAFIFACDTLGVPEMEM